MVGKDKAARVGSGVGELGEAGSGLPEAYQSALNCFIITAMHRHNFPTKKNAKFPFPLQTVAQVRECASMRACVEHINLTSSCESRCTATLSTA